MKRSLNLFYVVLLSLCLSINILAQSNAVSKNKFTNSDRSATSDSSSKKTTVERIEHDLSEALTLIQDNHYSGDDLNYNGLFKASIDSMLQTLDPHSGYYDAKEFEEFRTSQRSQYFGIGASINDLRDKNGKVIGTFIKATFDGAPANRAGLRYGDKIVEVNGVSMVGKGLDVVRNNLRGPRGTLAKVVVERYGTKKREAVEIVRDAISTPSISEAYMIRPGVGYISLSGGFNRTTFNEFQQAMGSFKAQGMKNLILDLRFNRGGLVREAYMIANTFLRRGQTVLTQKERDDSRSFAANNENPDDTNLVVLVNGISASSSEILAGALQDHDRALIVGETTYGKGLITNPYRLDYGSMLLLTIAKYETPSGRSIQRDYSTGSYYDYVSRNENAAKKIKREEKRTASGRIVYGGGGITPDVIVETPTISDAQQRLQNKLIDPIYVFAMDLAFGKVKGFEDYKVDRAIKYNYDLKSNDFPITEKVFKAFKTFATTNYKVTAQQVEKEKEFIARILRRDLATAAYGTRTSQQVFNEYDPQLKRAIKELPKAKELAIRGEKAYARKNGR